LVARLNHLLLTARRETEAYKKNGKEITNHFSFVFQVVNIESKKIIMPRQQTKNMKKRKFVRSI
jgi:hypothetical protein